MYRSTMNAILHLTSKTKRTVLFGSIILVAIVLLVLPFRIRAVLVPTIGSQYCRSRTFPSSSLLFDRSPFPFNHNIRANEFQIGRKTSCLSLFNLRNIEESNAVYEDSDGDRNPFPRNMLFLTSPAVRYPARVELNTYSKLVSSIIIVRYLEGGDLDNAVDLILSEYGSKAGVTKSKQDAPIPFQWLDDALTSYEDFSFGSLIKLGLWQRILRRKEGERPGMSSDHNVIICENVHGELLGMAEISLQPNTPTRTAPPVPMPDSIKALIARSESCHLVPYVSNVLVKPYCRGFGIGKILMAACEGRAKAMGFDTIYLHVDANISTGAAAQRLYKNLGYISEVHGYTDRNDAELKNEIVFIDELPLFYLYKKIKSQNISR